MLLMRVVFILKLGIEILFRRLARSGQTTITEEISDLSFWNSRFRDDAGGQFTGRGYLGRPRVTWHHGCKRITQLAGSGTHVCKGLRA